MFPQFYVHVDIQALLVVKHDYRLQCNFLIVWTFRIRFNHMDLCVVSCLHTGFWTWSNFQALVSFLDALLGQPTSAQCHLAFFLYSLFWFFFFFIISRSISFLCFTYSDGVCNSLSFNNDKTRKKITKCLDRNYTALQGFYVFSI